MYSVVLMMAMTTGGDVADCHRNSCSGGCTGYVAECSCSGGGHHLFGGRHGGCNGGCTGSYAYGGCTGGYYGGCTGGYYGGCSGGMMSPYGCTGGPVWGAPSGKPGEPIEKMPKVDKPKTGMAPAPATLIVSLPADAKLIIDDASTTSTSAERTFVSPNLNPGVDYNYNLKAEIVRDGKPVQVEQKVIVHAGETTRVTLRPLTVAAR